uniref:PH domain-containing protein n=1 Tax=Mesocestoides corti TaxID=53468 RepID=A0A5K3G1Y8_MESCO
RPLEGTLFRVFHGARSYLENYYGSSLNVCVPRTPMMRRGNVRHLPDKCKQMTVPCSTLDKLYPRVFRFNASDDSTVYEFDLQSDETQRCWVRTVFLARTQASIP